VIEIRQAAFVPVVVRVDLHGLPQAGDGGVGIAQHRIVQAQVIPDGIIVRGRLGKGLEKGSGLRVGAVVIEGHGIHQLAFDILRESE
jgi:hypothetical protein